MKKLLIFSSLAILGLLAPNPVEDLVQQSQLYFSQRPMEKVYLHLSQPYFTNGDQIWFNAYVLDYYESKPSSISEVLHILLIDPQGKVIQKHVVKVEEGVGAGYLTLPDVAETGNYRIVAYTNWMKNFDNSLFFDRNIKVISSIEDSQNHLDSTNIKLKVYIEGGEVLSNTRANVLVKLTGASPSQSSVHLLNTSGDTLQKISIDNQGMGTCSFIPSSKKRYNLIARQGDAIDRVPFPEIAESGTSLRLDTSMDGEVRLISECTNEFNGKPVYFSLQSNGSILFSLAGKFVNNRFITSLFKDELPDGLLHLTLIDDKGQIRNERFFYNEKKPSNIKAQVEFSRKAGVKSRLNLSIKIPDSLAFLSLAVRNERYFANYDHLAIDKYLTLSASSIDFNLDKSLLPAIDHFTISAKPSGYSWDKIVNNIKPKFTSSVEKKDNFVFSGLIQGNVQEKQQYSITMLGKEPKFYFAETERDGSFKFAIPSYSGSEKVIIKASPQDGSDLLDYKINSPEINLSARPYLKPTATQKRYALESKQNRATRRIYETSYKRQIDSTTGELAISFSILATMEASIKLTDYTPLSSMQEIATELLEGVRIRNENGSYKIQMRNKNEDNGYFTAFNEDEPLRLIDGLPIYDSNLIGTLNPLDVELIEMKYGKYTLNGVSFDGILHIHTVEGNYAELNDGNHLVINNPGFSKPVSFDSPEYQNSNSRIPDFRPLLYWNPNLKTDENGEANVVFFTSDDIGTYTVDIQGITASGRPISYQETLTVSEGLTSQ